MSAILTVEKLSKHFTLHDQRKTIPSCANVSFAVEPGSLSALIGPTGAGKSSVLKCIYRTYLPSAGRLTFRTATGETVDLAQASEHDVLALRKHEIGFVTQFLHCLPRKAAVDVVAEPLLVRGATRVEARDNARALLDALNVPERLWQVPPATFSGGEKQRVNLARGLIARPRLLLLDEPTASLDPGTTDKVVEILQGIKAEGVAMLAIFHHPDLVTRLADQVIELAPPAVCQSHSEATTQ
ncbi:phosphonate C-P lyase system protein PhnL [Burkholderia sp. Bp8963]|uniref:phosphonate C-P lyase system protein PhnL n=1 Tax=Burkholderia sp. Bp8963 TaxID=2184547 RepID=UPI000F5AF84C|nr:phosphonate C-P lyase system protein PhnL [Burkholderia sp. Bp8963]RQS71142.1 phosphonate C-P lyase system protein PhnL [Burkholderia sp. Bp8963]